MLNVSWVKDLSSSIDPVVLANYLVTDSAGNQNNVLKATASSATPKAANDVISHEHQNQNGTEATEQGAVFDGDYVNVHHDSTDNLIKNGPPEV